MASTFKGKINGYFDISTNTSANINGGNDGSKGFQSSGTNNLTFDFRGNAKSGLSSSANKQFTIGGGNANSGGANYKLSNGESSSDTSNGKDDKTSTGNIGKANDNIKKRIGFIFASGEANNGYVFGGEKQGYSGNIAGGTNDSKYYFANAGFLNRSQIEDAKGDLVLFNTAFRGDLGVKNKDVNIFLDFSENRNGLRAETKDDNANIVGSGSKNIVFNFTGNTLKEKYKGAVVGDATKTNANPDSSTPGSAGASTDNDTATYTMLNLKKYSADGTLDQASKGFLSLNNNDTQTLASGDTKTLINALQDSGLTNFDKPDAQSIKDNYESSSSSGHSSRARRELPNTATLASSADSSLSTSSTDTRSTKDSVTNIENLSKSATTLSLRGTSLDATNIKFNDYKYDLAFGTGMGTLEGITIEDSKLKGNIDLSSNNNGGHKIMMKGDSIEGTEVEIKFKDGNFGQNGTGVFYYDDSTATRSSTPKTLKLSGLKQTNFLRAGSAFKFSNTNLEGDLWASDRTSISLNFTNK